MFSTRRRGFPGASRRPAPASAGRAAPPNAASRTRASERSGKNDANRASFLGWSRLNRSLNPVPISTSLISGLPIRCVLYLDPELTGGNGDRRTVVRGRDVLAQTPMVAAVEFAASILPVRVSSETGTSVAIEFTAKPDTVSLAKFARLASCTALETGAIPKFKLSKAPPMSPKYGSSTVPAKPSRRSRSWYRPQRRPTPLSPSCAVRPWRAPLPHLQLQVMA